MIAAAARSLSSMTWLHSPAVRAAIDSIETLLKSLEDPKEPRQPHGLVGF